MIHCLSEKTKKFLFGILALIELLVVKGLANAGLLKDGSAVNEQVRIIQSTAGVNEGLSFGQTVAIILNAFFALLAIIFLVYIILAGWQWMTAQGESDKVNKSKDTIKHAVIGLIIILAAYSITHFVFSSMDKLSQ